MDLDSRQMTAGLVLKRPCDRTMAEMTAHVDAALAAFGLTVSGTTHISAHSAVVQADGRLIHLALASGAGTPLADRGARILHVCVDDQSATRTATPPAPEASTLLAEITIRLFTALHPSHVTWLDAAILTHDEFAEITGAGPIHARDEPPMRSLFADDPDEATRLAG